MIEAATDSGAAQVVLSLCRVARLYIANRAVA
jgi:hypothetical protein